MSAVPGLEVDVRLGLDRFDLEVAFAATRPATALFGPSGAGKSSLLEVVAGLRRGARGRVGLGSVPWLDTAAGLFVPPEGRRVGYVPQDGLLFPHWSVRRNLLAGAGDDAALEPVARLLELDPLLERRPATLSGGERQRVALGRALLARPRLLLLDEPLAALDLPLRRRLLPYLRRVRDELTVPMLLVTHDPLEVQALADEVVALDRGRVVAQGEPRAVLTDPRVFPLAEEKTYENVLPGRVARHADGMTAVELTGGVEVLAAPTAAEIGREVLLGLRADEILVATETPRGLSARNVLAARVTELRPLGRLVLLSAEVAPGVPLAVELTEATPAALGLEPGKPVDLVFKATSCRLYGDLREGERAER